MWTVLTALVIWSGDCSQGGGGGSKLSDQDVTADDETMLRVSTIESPCSDHLSDYHVNSSSEDQEFSIDMSSTRKRRR